MTIPMALDLFLASCRLRNLSGRTIECYTDFINRFIRSGLAEDVADLNYSVVAEYIEKLMESCLKPSTIATYLRHLKVFIKWLEAEEYIEKEKAFSHKIKLPRTGKKVVRIYTDDEIRTIFNEIRIEIEWIRVRNCAIVALMLDSGIRQNEVCSIKKEDYIIRDSFLKVRGKGNKERIVPLGKLTQHYVAQYLKLCPFRDGDMLFLSITGRPLTRNAVKLLISKLSRQLPFEFSSHKLRHNFATNYCLDQYDKYGQVDIYKLMVLLGHEDIKTTRRYLHLANQIIASKSNISHLDKILLGTQ